MKKYLSYALCLLVISFKVQAHEGPESCPMAASVLAMLQSSRMGTMHQVYPPYQWMGASGFVYDEPGEYDYHFLKNSFGTPFDWQVSLTKVRAFSAQAAANKVMNERDLIIYKEKPEYSSFIPTYSCYYDAQSDWKVSLYYRVPTMSH